MCAGIVYKKNKGKQFYNRRYNFLMAFNEIRAYKGLFSSVLIFMHYKKNLLSQLQRLTCTFGLVTSPPFNLFQRNLLYTKTFSYFLLAKKKSNLIKQVFFIASRLMKTIPLNRKFKRQNDRQELTRLLRNLVTIFRGPQPLTRTYDYL